MDQIVTHLSLLQQNIQNNTVGILYYILFMNQFVETAYM